MFLTEKNCKAESVKTMQKEMRDIFGLGTADGNAGYFGITGILWWAYQLSYEYHGQAMRRGMMCDLFEICIKNDDGTTALISYYWSCRL